VCVYACVCVRVHVRVYVYVYVRVCMYMVYVCVSKVSSIAIFPKLNGELAFEILK